MQSHDHYVVALLSALATRPDDGVIWWRDRRITASELRHSIMTAAVVLRRAGLDETRTVTLLMSGNTPDMLIARYAANLLGATVIHGQSVNAAHPLDELSIEAQADILSESEISLLIVDAENVARGRAVSAKMATRPRLATLTSDVARSADILDLSSAPGAAFDLDTAVSGDVATVQYTSGFTGRPKGVPRTFAAWSSLLAPTSPARSMPDGTVLISTPLAQTWSADKELVGNGTVVLHDGFDASAVLTAIAEHRIMRLYLAAPQLYQLADQLARTRTDTSSLTQIMYAGSTASPRRVLQALDAFGPILIQLYGSTEAGMISLLLPWEHTPKLLTTVGRPAFEVAIRDERTGEDLRPGQTGEICVRSPVMMSGYWRDPEATRQRLRDGWFHTGDVGYLDDEGYLHLVDRVARMIKSRGIKIYPAAIEGVLLEDAAVAQASVHSVFDPDAVEHVYATVVPYQGAAVDPERLCALVESKLSGTHVPARIIVRDKLPLLDSGKPDVRRLRFEAEVAAGWRQPSA